MDFNRASHLAETETEAINSQKPVPFNVKVIVAEGLK
jgi:hypothetical protein